ncbi:MAG: cupin domain-containing protein [Victivallaceae bacterium]|nr:cupin domain-containing protein [Victivallaceae bacterium]
MKFQTIKLIAAGLLAATITGCSTTTPEATAPKTTATEVKIPVKGLKVIEKNLKTLQPMPHTTTTGAGCYELFSSQRDDIKPDCSLLFIRVEPGEELIKHSMTSGLIIYVIAGGGNLTVDGHAYIMSAGEIIYVPGGKSRHVLNNSKKTLKFLMYISPAYKKESITVLQERKPAVLSEQEIKAKQNKAIAKKVLGKNAQNIGKETVENVQELTPKETKIPSTPPDSTLQ